MIFTTTSVREFSQGKKCSEIIGHLLRVLFMSWVFCTSGRADREPGDHSNVPSAHRSGHQSGQLGSFLPILQQVTLLKPWSRTNSHIDHCHMSWSWKVCFLLNAVGEIWRLRGLSWDLMKIQSKHWSRLIGCLFLFFFWLLNHGASSSLHFYVSLLLLFRCPSLLIVGDTSPAVEAVVSD